MNELPLATGLTAKTNQLCIGLEDGVADIYELVTPTTAELLRCWKANGSPRYRRPNMVIRRFA